MSNALGALSGAMLKGFLRDKASVFFAIIFPLMFLVLFGSLFADQNQAKSDLIQVGDVALFDDLPGPAKEAFDDAFEVEKSDDLDAALEKVRKGDADVAVEQRGNEVIAHYTQTDPARAATTQGTLSAFIDGANVAALEQAAGANAPPTLTFTAEQVEDDSLKTIQYVTPGLLGWAVAMSASFGAAATLQGWRQSKLLRRLQLSPVKTGTIVSARILVTVVVAMTQMAIFVGLGLGLFGLQLTGSWVMAIPILLVGTLCFMAIGLLAGAVAKTTEGAVNMANFIVLPMSFLSGSFFPLDGAPGWLQAISKVLPLRWLNEGMLDVMVRGEPASAALLPMAILAAFAAVIAGLAAYLFRWEST